MSNKTKKLLILNLPYFIAGLVCTNLGEAWRIAEGADMSEKLLGFLSALGAASVSYTHLDVYKRQCQKNQTGGNCVT